MADAMEAALLAYFRNNVLHLFVLPALIARLLIDRGAFADSRWPAALEAMLAPLRDRLCWHLSDANLPAALEDSLVRLAARGLIEREDDVWHPPAREAPAYAALGWLANILAPELRALPEPH
ncbi:MAG: hypothetical protein QMD73_04460 [Rhodocyclaceae bacterium]|nr:hypothetical protein [Rhodocyclaceae bacterium]